MTRERGTLNWEQGTLNWEQGTLNWEQGTEKRLLRDGFGFLQGFRVLGIWDLFLPVREYS